MSGRSPGPKSWPIRRSSRSAASTSIRIRILYALHGADGSRLAVMSDKETAVAAAQAHELAVVSLH